jgi:hypothetical protein
LAEAVTDASPEALIVAKVAERVADGPEPGALKLTMPPATGSPA